MQKEVYSYEYDKEVEKRVDHIACMCSGYNLTTLAFAVVALVLLSITYDGMRGTKRELLVSQSEFGWKRRPLTMDPLFVGKHPFFDDVLRLGEEIADVTGSSLFMETATDLPMPASEERFIAYGKCYARYDNEVAAFLNGTSNHMGHVSRAAWGDRCANELALPDMGMVLWSPTASRDMFHGDPVLGLFSSIPFVPSEQAYREFTTANVEPLNRLLASFDLVALPAFAVAESVSLWSNLDLHDPSVLDGARVVARGWSADFFESLGATIVHPATWDEMISGIAFDGTIDVLDLSHDHPPYVMKWLSRTEVKAFAPSWSAPVSVYWLVVRKRVWDAWSVRQQQHVATIAQGSLERSSRFMHKEIRFDLTRLIDENRLEYLSTATQKTLQTRFNRILAQQMSTYPLFRSVFSSLNDMVYRHGVRRSLFDLPYPARVAPYPVGTQLKVLIDPIAPTWSQVLEAVNHVESEDITLTGFALASVMGHQALVFAPDDESSVLAALPLVSPSSVSDGVVVSLSRLPGSFLAFFQDSLMTELPRSVVQLVSGQVLIRPDSPADAALMSAFLNSPSYSVPRILFADDETVDFQAFVIARPVSVTMVEILQKMSSASVAIESFNLTPDYFAFTVSRRNLFFVRSILSASTLIPLLDQRIRSSAWFAQRRLRVSADETVLLVRSNPALFSVLMR